MSREIKFKAYHKTLKKMAQVLQLDIEAQGVWVQFPNPDMAIPEAAFWEYKDIVLIQYTGLKDRNGVEIYEGDVCKCHVFTQELGENMGVIEGEYEFVCTIEIYSSGVHLRDASNNESGPLFAYGGFHEESLEVIGDIYATPELLGGQNG